MSRDSGTDRVVEWLFCSGNFSLVPKDAKEISIETFAETQAF
jgi:hypothetical protein